jgi:hypothetical protein
MKTRVFKYHIGPTGESLIPMPKGAVVRSVGVQGDNIVVWASVDTDQPLEARRFVVVWTGEEDPPSGTFLGTVSNPHTGIVSHVFEPFQGR